MKKITKIATSLLVGGALLLSGCGRDLSSDTYVSSGTMGVVLEGQVTSVRAVKVKESDKLGKQDGTGMIAGGLMGGIAGSTIGKGTGAGLATVGAALAGGILGNVIQDKLSTSEGFEYIVKIDRKTLPADYTSKKMTINGGETVQSKLLNSVAANNIITVVQGKDVALQSGDKVNVIITDDRVRLARR